MPIFYKTLNIMLRPWFIILFLSFVVGSYIYLDRDIALFFESLDLRNNLMILTWITNIGLLKIYLVSLPILAIIFAYILRNKAFSLKIWALWLFVLSPALVSFVLKTIAGRARPIVFFKQHYFGFFGWHFDHDFRSFPSGHTTTITSLAIGLTILFPRYFIYWASICLLVISSRVMLTDHYLSDVLASFYLVFLELGVIIYIMRRKFPKTYELISK